MTRDPELVAAGRAVTEADVSAFLATLTRADADICVRASAGNLNPKHLKHAQRVQIVTRAVNAGAHQARGAIAAGVQERYLEILGQQAFDNPTGEQLLASTTQVLEVIPVSIVRLYLTGIVGEPNATAAGLIREMLDAGEPIPSLISQAASEPVYTQPPVETPIDQPIATPTSKVSPPQDREDELDYTVVDQMLIREAIACAAGQEGAWSPQDMQALVREVIDLNASRKRTWLHVGYLEGLGLAQGGWMGQRPEMNEERRLWRLSGIVLAGLRVDRDALKRIAEAAPEDCLEIACDERMGRSLRLPVLQAFLDHQPDQACALLRRSPLELRSLSVEVELDMLDAVRSRVGRYLDTGEARRAQVLLEHAISRFERLVEVVPPQAEVDLRMVAGQRVELAVLLSTSLRNSNRFDPAQRVCERIDDSECCLAPAQAQASLLAEKGLIVAGARKLQHFRPPAGADQAQETRARLRPAAEYFERSLDQDPQNTTSAYMLGCLCWAQGEYDRASQLFDIARSRIEVNADYSRLSAFLDLYFGLSKLFSLEVGQTGLAIGNISRAVHDGARLQQEWASQAIDALLAMDSPHVTGFFEVLQRPGAVGVLPVKGMQEALDRYAELAQTIPAVVKRVQPADRVGLLSAGLDAAARLCQDELFEELLDQLETTLDGASASLWATWARELSGRPNLRDHVGEEVFMIWVAQLAGNTGDSALESALLIPLAQKHLAARTHLALVADLVDAVGGIAGADVVSQMRASLQDSMAVSQAVVTETAEPITVLFVGGDERQERFRQGIDTQFSGLGEVDVIWHHPGWSPNWARAAEDVEDDYPRADIVVLMPYVRTNFGRRIRRTAGESGLRWEACTGTGVGSMRRAIERAARLVAAGRG